MSAKKKTTPRKQRGNRYKEELLLTLQVVFGGDQVETEYRFHPTRRWRFDYAVPNLKIAVEYQGHGQMSGRKNDHVGGHASVKGLANDCQKFNEAQILGWKVIKFTALHFSERQRAANKLHNVFDTLMLIKVDPTQW